MWLRLALRLFVFLSAFSACSPSDRQAVDKLNSLSYAYHYRNIDSTEYYARKALHLSQHYRDGQAEALNNLAFASIARMHYDEAKLQLDSVTDLTDNQLELLIANIQQMRLCQRRSRNREFYDYREKAQQALRRINEDLPGLNDRQRQRLLYAETELSIVTSTYYYYVGLEQQSVEALKAIDTKVNSDAVWVKESFVPQHLNYLYNIGAGGIITANTQLEVYQQEFDYLLRCLILARQHNYPYFEANSLEGLAEHLIKSEKWELLLHNNLYALSYLNTDDVSPAELPGQLAEEALCLFRQYGDVYQTAGAYRSLASCARANGNYASALYYLERALDDSLVFQAPDLVASIREQLSVAYSAMDDKAASDYNRNIYLDLQEQTRQDRSLEARAAQLDNTVGRLNRLLLAIAIAIFLLIGQIMFLYKWHYRWLSKNKLTERANEQLEEIGELIASRKLQIEKSERRNAEQRAKISLAISITPFIDRILYEVEHDSFDRDFLHELIDKINEQNDLLTQWIQLRQGELSLHIETFPLQPLFDIVAKSRKSFEMNGVELNIDASNCQVKADRVLTLFMLNTLADNARKFTSPGGTVKISATETDNYVEVNVTDNGKGMDEDTLAHLFDRKPIIDKQSAVHHHGFGLLNCKGIIEKYRKTSRIFSVCELRAESQLGHGSRFFFRLPKGIAKAVALLFIGCSTLCAQNAELSKASIYADSAYYANISGNYGRSLLYADMCRQSLNAFYRQARPGKTDTLLFKGSQSLVPPEVLWFRDSVKVNYSILLMMRNETAVSALALHEWELYAYNNSIYTQLFKELSADTQLEAYCRKMQQSQENHTVAIMLLAVILLVVLLVIVLQVLYTMQRKAMQQQQLQADMSQKEDELRRTEMEDAYLHVSNQVLDNCLSALKHETMYYPSRIRLLLDSSDTSSLPEVVGYYRELYAILTEQAMTQMAGTRLHLKSLDHEILGDENLIDYLFDILRRQAGQKEPLSVEYASKDEHYVMCRVAMPHLQLDSDEARMLFMPVGGQEDKSHIPYLVCRQIVRDHGEATGRRACGIWAEVVKGQTNIVIILPKQICKTSK